MTEQDRPEPQPEQPPVDWTVRPQQPAAPHQEPSPTGQPPTGQPPTGQPPTGQPPTGQPPYGQLQPGQQLGAQPGQHALAPGQAAPPLAPSSVPRHADPTARVSGWVWPVVVMLALVVGVIGGVVGAAGFRIIDDATDDPTLVSNGLDGVDLATEAPLEAADGTIANVAAEVLPSTVQIIAAHGGDSEGATGSGFVLDKQGHVITNNHVVAQAAEGGRIQVVDQDGNRFAASVVGRSAVYDLAVLVAVEMAGKYRPTSLGASNRLRVGETVVAIGSPLGLSSTVTAGIVSALQRPVTTGDPDEEASYINAVQTDAAINPGNSGGPLVNLLGQVVGVNSAIATTGGFGSESGNIGVGFAIPVEQVRITADQILRTGEALYPVIGAQVRTGSEQGSGAEIQKVNPDSAAEEGGLEKGDLVVAVDGERVTDGISLIVSIRTHQPGESIEFTVDRDGQQRTLTIELRGEVG